MGAPHIPWVTPPVQAGLVPGQRQHLKDSEARLAWLALACLSSPALSCVPCWSSPRNLNICNVPLMSPLSPLHPSGIAPMTAAFLWGPAESPLGTEHLFCTISFWDLSDESEGRPDSGVYAQYWFLTHSRHSINVSPKG